MWVQVVITSFTFNNNATCGSNTFTCGTLICTSGTLGGQTIATVNQIPLLRGYATLASPALTGSPTVSGNPILGRTTTLDPAYYGAGRRIELDVSVANTARLDFHSYDTNTTVDYDGRIVCTSGVANTAGGGTISYVYRYLTHIHRIR